MNAQIAACRAGAGLLVLLTISACAGLSGHGTAPAHADSSFGTDAEKVFRRQNRVFDELIARNQNGGDDTAGLGAAEERLSHSCRYVNAAANAMENGQNVTFSLKIEAMNTLKDCDSTARQVWQLLGHDAGDDPLNAPAY